MNQMLFEPISGHGIWWADAGYNLEDWLSDKHTPSRKSAIERREERRANEGEADYQVVV